MELRKCLIVDVVVLLAYLVVANPALTGIDVHEWIGVGLFALFVVHTVQHYDWIRDTVSPERTHRPWQRVGNLVLDVLILVSFMVCTVSGLMISGAVLAALGLYADGYYLWDPLHAASAKLMLALLIVHLALHARMVWKAVRSGLARSGGDDAGLKE